MSDSNIAIDVKNVSKYFLLPHQKAGTLKSFFVNPLRKFEVEKQHVLNNVSFEIKQGEFFGIVGRNGSGKSTLLKCIAGVYTPDKGHIKVNGSLVPFIELGVGFNPELSGRDNVFLNGSLLGFNRKEMLEMYDEIVDFAELEEHMDQKLKNYSSGMQVRLAFSIAIKAKGNTLLLDEVLAVGDEAFREKCFEYFFNLKKSKTTVILVTHSMDSIERFCTRAMLLDSGKIVKIGEPSKIAQLYSDVNALSTKSKETQRTPYKYDPNNKKGVQVSVDVQDSYGRIVESINPSTDVYISVNITSDKDLKELSLGLIIYNRRDIPIFASNSRKEGIELEVSRKKSTNLLYKIDNIFANGPHRIKVGLRDQDSGHGYFVDDKSAGFISIGRRHSHAIVSPNHKIEIKKAKVD